MKYRMRSERPITTLYSNNPDARVTTTTAGRAGHSTTLDAACGAALRKVMKRQWQRADVYNRFGTWCYAVVRYPHRGVAVEEINNPLHMNSDKQQPNRRKPGNPGKRAHGNLLLRLT